MSYFLLTDHFKLATSAVTSSSFKSKWFIANNEQTKREIQESINSTMKWYIGSAGIVLVVLKALDLFVK